MARTAAAKRPHKRAEPQSLWAHGRFHWNELRTRDAEQEVDHFWEKLSAGGEKGRCGWLTDKYGVSWQIVPTALYVLMQDPDIEKTDRVMKALMQMGKLDIQGLRKAYHGAGGG